MNQPPSIEWKPNKDMDLKTAKGTTTWSFKAPLKHGKNTVTFFATDATGNISPSKIIKITRK
jgi:hypothetical protein